MVRAAIKAHLALVQTPGNMPTKNEIMVVRTLRDRKTRWEERKFVVEGHKGVAEAMSSGWKVCAVYAESRVSVEADWNPECVSAKDMARMSSLRTPPGIMAVMEMPDASASPPAEREEWPPFSLALDGIADPGNLGTILRTADWFGLSGVWISGDSVDPFNPKVVQATMGAIFRVGAWVVDLPDVLENAATAGCRILGLDLSGKSMWEDESDDVPTVAVIGSESHGISSAVRPLCSEFITIPGKGQSESLNAAMAAGIVMAAHDGLGRFNPK